MQNENFTTRVAATAARLWIEFVNETKTAKYMPGLVRSPYDISTPAGSTNIRLAIFDALTVEVKSYNDIHAVLDQLGIKDRSGGLNGMAGRIAESPLMQDMVLEVVEAR